MDRQPKHHISELQFEKIPTIASFQCWRTSFKTEVCSGSNYPSEAMRWIEEVEMATSADDLKTSQSIFGHQFPNFEMLDVKIASSLKKIVQNSNFQKRVFVLEPKKKMTDSVRGRQIAFMICEIFRATGTHASSA